MTELRRITEVPCECLCGWLGKTGACESGNEGELCCPLCWPVEVPVVIHYNEHEINPRGPG